MDGAAVAHHYAEPSAIAQGGEFTYWPEQGAVVRNMVTPCNQYRERGYLCASFEPGQFIAQGNDDAVADLRWRIEWLQHEASVFNTTYNLVRAQDGWRVLVCTAYSENELHAQSAVSDRADR
jgi:hypothetical protein